MKKLTQEQIDEIIGQHFLLVNTTLKNALTANLKKTNMEGANLRYANPEGANLQDARTRTPSKVHKRS